MLTPTRWLPLMVVLLSSAAEATAGERPNVLLIITDDQGYGDFSIHDNPLLRTPNIDWLAQQGMRFDRFFVSPVCAPTRASLLTGRYSLRCGVWGVTHGKETMRSEEVTLAEVLRGAGYRTGIFGKWHNGEHFPYTPQGQGFEEFFGFHNGHWNNYFDTELEHNGKMVKTKGYIADVLTDEALRYMSARDQRPFFCYLSYNTPHSPFQVPDEYFNRFKSKGLDAALASIYGMCENLDDNVGRLLAFLEERKLADNTIMIFLTDNGPNGARFNAGMRGVKGSVHEGGGRVPLFIRWPARLPVPEHRPRPPIRQIAAHIDVLPTVLDLCGVKRTEGPPLDGRSLAPLLFNEGAWPERTLFTHQVRVKPTLFPGAARTQRYRLVNEGKGYQLYDMQADPEQKRDVAEQHPQVVAELSQAYEEWFRDVTRTPLARLPIPVGYAEEDPVLLPAPQAQLDRLEFFGKNGYANDWITGWTSTEANARWEIDVVKGGRFEVTLGFLCPENEAGSKLRLTVGTTAREVIVPGTPMGEIPLPHRVADAKHYVNMRWHVLSLGALDLPEGAAAITIRALSIARNRALDLKHVELRRVKS